MSQSKEADGIITTDRLREILGLQQPSAIERWLRRNNVRYFLGRNGPFTTIDLLHASVGFVSSRSVEQELYHKWKDA